MTELNFLDLFRSIEKLKQKEREGWKNRDIERPLDTIASHSYSSAVIAWILAEKSEADTEKAVKMALVHDLVMAYMPDLTPQDERFGDKKYIEKQKTEELLEDLPVEIREEVEKLLNELRQRNTETAKIAKEADKTDTLLQAYSYSKDREESFLEEFISHSEEDFSTEVGQDILEQIRQLVPEQEE